MECITDLVTAGEKRCSHQSPAKEESKPFIYEKYFRQKQEVIKRQWSGFQLISKFIKIWEANL